MRATFAPPHDLVVSARRDAAFRATAYRHVSYLADLVIGERAAELLIPEIELLSGALFVAVSLWDGGKQTLGDEAAGVVRTVRNRKRKGGKHRILPKSATVAVLALAPAVVQWAQRRWSIGVGASLREVWDAMNSIEALGRRVWVLQRQAWARERRRGDGEVQLSMRVAHFLAMVARSPTLIAWGIVWLLRRSVVAGIAGVRTAGAGFVSLLASALSHSYIAIGKATRAGRIHPSRAKLLEQALSIAFALLLTTLKYTSHPDAPTLLTHSLLLQHTHHQPTPPTLSTPPPTSTPLPPREEAEETEEGGGGGGGEGRDDGGGGGEGERDGGRSSLAPHHYAQTSPLYSPGLELLREDTRGSGMEEEEEEEEEEEGGEDGEEEGGRVRELIRGARKVMMDWEGVVSGLEVSEDDERLFRALGSQMVRNLSTVQLVSFLDQGARGREIQGYPLSLLEVFMGIQAVQLRPSPPNTSLPPTTPITTTLLSTAFIESLSHLVTAIQSATTHAFLNPPPPHPSESPVPLTHSLGDIPPDLNTKIPTRSEEEEEEEEGGGGGGDGGEGGGGGEEKGRDSTPHQCPVCLQPRTHPSLLPCGHVLCWLCAVECARRQGKCPMCRASIKPPQILPLQSYQ